MTEGQRLGQGGIMIAASTPTRRHTPSGEPEPGAGEGNRPERTSKQPHWLVSAAAVVAGALLVGGLSSFGQTVLPPAINSLANSAGGWSAFVFLLVWASRARPALAAILGLVGFELMLEAYGAVSGLRGYYYAAPFSTLYAKAALIAGPVLGIGAAFVRHGSPARRLLGVAPLSAVLMVEGGYGLLSLLGSTSPVYWTLELVGGASILALALVRLRRA